MPQVFKLRARLRSSHLGALGIALLFWGAVSQTIYVVGSIIAEGCIRLIDLYIHTSPRMYTLLRKSGILWGVSAWNLWMAFLGGTAAVMIAAWLYGPEKQR